MKPERVRRLRARLGLTRAKLAEILDVSIATIGHWETGHCSPRYEETLQKLKKLENGRENLACRRVTPGQVKKIRESRGLSQKEFAQKLLITGGILGTWERGEVQIPAVYNEIFHNMKKELEK